MKGGTLQGVTSRAAAPRAYSPAGGRRGVENAPSVAAGLECA